LVIQTLRNKFFFGALIAEALRIGIFGNIHDLLFYVDRKWQQLELSKGVKVGNQVPSTAIMSLGLSSIPFMSQADANKAITTCFRTSSIGGIWPMHALCKSLMDLAKAQDQSQKINVTVT
jgi:hypothetical protein